MPQVLARLRLLRPGSKAVVWGGSAALVALAFLFRASIHPLVGGSIAFSTFLPVIILIAYAFGRLPAVASAVVSANLALFCFVEPAFAFTFTPNALSAYALFLVSSGVAIIVITGLTGALRTLSHDLGRAQAVADSHAGLFRELNERMTHHMRLVAGVLALQAKGEPEPQVAESLRRAMERTLLISRVHRELGGQGDTRVRFDDFAAALARAVCASRGQPAERVTVEGPGIELGVEEATSLGVALTECLTALLALGAASALKVRLGAGESLTEVAISEAGVEVQGALVSVTNGLLLRAMAEQLGATVALRADAQGSALVLSMPRAAPGSAGAAATVH